MLQILMFSACCRGAAVCCMLSKLLSNLSAAANSLILLAPHSLSGKYRDMVC